MHATLHARLKLAGLEDHPLRERLNSEFHARLPIPLVSPLIVSHLVFKHEGLSVQDERDNLTRLCQSSVCQSIESSDTHLMLDAGSYRLRWELHTEFSSYTFFRPLAVGEPHNLDSTALDAILPEWLAAIPGQLIVATHVELRSTAEMSPESVTAGFPSTGRQMVAVQVADGAAWVFTDFMFDNGFSRFLVLDASMTQRQAGRAVQRLVEIETYRLMALLGLPVAKEVGRWLSGAEKQLAELMDHIGQARTPDDERAVLARLSTLAAEVEHSVARTTFRFGASRAYYSLVMQRIEDLRELRVSGFPTLNEFMQRRLLPAMDTCAAMARRQDDLSGRVARNSQLLRTRVDIELERQNQELLAQMNNRAKLQLRLQETVEGLSVVAITYYGSQLVHYLAKGAKYWLSGLSPEMATAVAIPLIALLSLFGLKRMRKALAQEEASGH
jgi:uncharacterized membrane-anchored protein